MTKSITVGIADMKYARNDGILVTYALGSCIGICLYDPVVKLAAMVHIMLPYKLNNSNDNNIYKYADTGIRMTIKKMETFGAVKKRITAKIAGGAKMFDIPGNGSLGNIGKRNIESVREILKSEKIPIVSEQVGGNFARTLFFDCSSGVGKIRSYGKSDIVF